MKSLYQASSQVRYPDQERNSYDEKKVSDLTVYIMLLKERQCQRIDIREQKADLLVAEVEIQHYL